MNVRLPAYVLMWAMALPLAGLPVAEATQWTEELRVETLNQALRAFDRATELRHSEPAEARRLFRESAEKLQLLVDSGVRNGKLYYDLGNAYLRGGDLGRAILNYRRAERLIPGDAQLQANLDFARDLRQDQIQASAQRKLIHTFLAWHFNVPTRIRYGIGLAFYVLFWCVLIVRPFLRRVAWGYVLVPVAALWLSLGSSVVYDLVTHSRQHEGVLLADEVVVRKGNGEGFEPQFEQPLHAGTEFAVLERRQDWLHISLPDGKTGWIRAGQAELI